MFLARSISARTFIKCAESSTKEAVIPDTRPVFAPFIFSKYLFLAAFEMWFDKPPYRILWEEETIKHWKNDRRKWGKGSLGVQISPANLNLCVRPQFLLQLFYLLGRGGGGNGSCLAGCQWKSKPISINLLITVCGLSVSGDGVAIDDSMVARINNSASYQHSSRAADKQSSGGALVDIVYIHWSWPQK